jgi:inhibitor of cysteine peptidase
MRHDISTQSSVSVGDGDELVLVLSENASTGFVWQVDACPEFLDLSDDERGPDGAAPGAAATRQLTFRVYGSGEGVLELSLRRPWETGVAPAETRELLVTATP